MKILLSFLTHETGSSLHNRHFPLSIGLISEFIKANIKGVETFLFKRPSLLSKHVENNKPDIAMFGNYMWVEKLSLYYARCIKSIYPKTLIVFGGPNLSLVPERNIDFLKKNSFIDIVIKGDAEIVSMNIVKSFMENNYDIEKLKSLNIPNTTSISHISGKVFDGDNKDFRLGIGETSLEHIPSPYLSGAMDPFFEDNAIALLESNRGCPYGCTFCQQGTKYFSKIRYYNDVRVLAELEYIAKKVTKESIDMSEVEFCDPNFGQYKQDTKIFEHIRSMQDEYDYPKFIFSSSGKSQPERVLSNSKILKEGSMTIRAAVQSMNETTLKNIERKNLPIEVFKNLSKEGIDTYSETMLGLPSETKQSYFDGIFKLIDAGIDEFSNHQTIMIKGTPMEFDDYKIRFGFKTKYRVIPECDGFYKVGKFNSRITETEEIIYETNTLTYEEYLECRKFALLVMIFHNTRLLRPIYLFLESKNLNRSELLKKIGDEVVKNKSKINELVDNFLEDTKKELSDKDPIFKDKINIDELSSNKLYKYSTRALLYYKSEVLQLIENSLKIIFKLEKFDAEINQILNIVELSFLDTLSIDEEDVAEKLKEEINLTENLRKVYNADCVRVSLSDFQKNKLIALNQMYRTKSDRETKMPYHLNTIGLIKSVNYYSLQNKNITWTKFSHIAQERSN